MGECDVVARITCRWCDTVHLCSAISGVAVDVVLRVPRKILNLDCEVLVGGRGDREEARGDDLIDRWRVEVVPHSFAPGRAGLVQLKSDGGRCFTAGEDGHDADDRWREVKGEATCQLCQDWSRYVVRCRCWEDGARSLCELVIFCRAVHVVLGLHCEQRDFHVEVPVDVVPVRHGVSVDDTRGEGRVKRSIGGLWGGVGLAVRGPGLIQLERDSDRRLFCGFGFYENDDWRRDVRSPDVKHFPTNWRVVGRRGRSTKGRIHVCLGLVVRTRIGRAERARSLRMARMLNCLVFDPTVRVIERAPLQQIESCIVL
mmetsp:Transcript_86504/g.155805  ORF Transcript_86504/g.155805 Transcript_86504/m.155805 type:complete len:314 (+) Transcript_86504:510-1451(+)